MSATMARQEGWVQLEHSNMCLAMNMAKLAKGGFLRAAIEEMQSIIKKPRTKVREEKKWGVEFPGHEKVTTAMERHPALLRQTHTARCLPCQNGTATYSETPCRCKKEGPLPPKWRRQQSPMPTPESMPPPPGMPPPTASHTSGDQSFQIVNLLAGFVYSHISFHCAESFTLDASAHNSQNETDFDPDMLTDERTATG